MILTVYPAIQSLTHLHLTKPQKTLSITNQISPTVWTVRTRYSSTYEEKESTSFSTTGTVKTADGRELNFNLDMTMSRRYMEEHSIEFVSALTLY